jgi:hypothetical protein
MILYRKVYSGGSEIGTFPDAPTAALFAAPSTSASGTSWIK